MTPKTVIAALLAVAPLFLADPVAAGDVAVCVESDPYGFCIEWDVPTPGNPGSPGDSGTDEVECYWVTIPDIDDPTIFVDFGLPEPPADVDIVWQERECSDGSVQFTFRWVIPATPENLATIARGRLMGELPQPSVMSSPPMGTASIVGVPVFVEVTNWTGVVSESECAGGLCVTVTATPRLTFDPGEPGSEVVACASSGSRFAADGGSLDTQASAPGACVYGYRLRTGVEGRPELWPGMASVTWTLSWTASSGASGSLPAVTRSTGLPRGVQEVQTVVVGGEAP